MCRGMFSLYGEVVFIHSKHVNKIVSCTLILVVIYGLLKDYLRRVICSVNPELAKMSVLGVKCFPPYLR